MKDTITRLFTRHFGAAVSPLVVRSPGRINIIGEHTDYNDGFVLPAAINKAAYIAMSLRDDEEIHILAHDLHETYSVAIPDLQPVAGIHWSNYILGVIAQFKKRGVALRGLNIVLTSDIPVGAGLSSSAAIECAAVFALNELLETNLDRICLVKMAQQAEHEYAGVLCGIMDQFASMMGKKQHVIKLDCKTLAYEYVPFTTTGISILLLNTNVKHSLASSEYNIRRHECNLGAAWIKKHHPLVYSLRDATREMLDQYVLPKDKTVYNRCLFVVEEINRLQVACEDLQNGDVNALGKKMFATHEGLSNNYAVSCKELDYLVHFAKEKKEIAGARMMGGGFGGCTINLIQNNTIEPFITELKPAYEAAMNLPLTYYTASIDNGTEILY